MTNKENILHSMAMWCPSIHHVCFILLFCWVLLINRFLHIQKNILHFINDRVVKQGRSLPENKRDDSTIKFKRWKKKEFTFNLERIHINLKLAFIYLIDELVDGH